jgi:hypothetical protein
MTIDENVTMTKWENDFILGWHGNKTETYCATTITGERLVVSQLLWQWAREWLYYSCYDNRQEIDCVTFAMTKG